MNTPPTMTVDDGPCVEGIDVSAWSGEVDWSKIAAAGKQFAFVKASEGQNIKDSLFLWHWKQARAAGVKVGAYHFVRGYVPAEAQFHNFMSQYSRVEPGELPVVLDIEVPFLDTKECFKLAHMLEDECKTEVMIYTMASQLSGLCEDMREFPLWAAHWNVAKPSIHRFWKDWTVWQYSSTGVIPGLPGNRWDLNRIRLSDWDWFQNAPQAYR